MLLFDINRKMKTVVHEIDYRVGSGTKYISGEKDILFIVNNNALDKEFMEMIEAMNFYYGLTYSIYNVSIEGNIDFEAPRGPANLPLEEQGTLGKDFRGKTIVILDSEFTISDNLDIYTLDVILSTTLSKSC